MCYISVRPGYLMKLSGRTASFVITTTLLARRGLVWRAFGPRLRQVREMGLHGRSVGVSLRCCQRVSREHRVPCAVVVLLLGTHADMFLAEVVGVQGRRSFISTPGSLHLERADLIVYS